MNKTEHYQLNQWELHDRVLMDDFNADNAKIDAALKAEADARTAADAAINTALSKLGNCRMELLTYVGTSKYGQNNPNTLTFSKPPKLVVIVGSISFALIPYGAGRVPSMCKINGSDIIFTELSCTWQDNVLKYWSSHASMQLNDSTNRYYVFALFAEDEE